MLPSAVIAALAALFVFGVSASATPTIPKADYCVDADSFYFDVELAGVPDEPNIIFRIASDDAAFTGANMERIELNYDSGTGTIIAGPEVNSFGSAPDRWLNGNIADFTLSSLGGESWSIVGSVPHGVNPFAAGDNVNHTVIKAVSFSDVSIFNASIASCAPATSTPTPTPSPSPSPTPTPTATPTPTSSPPPTGTSTPTPTPSITATPTPVPTPTSIGQTPGPTPTPTPAGTPSAANALWGDDDCNGAVAAVDGLKSLQDVAAIPYSQNDPCFVLGGTVGVQPAGFGDLVWGDVDCDGDLDAVDALSILRSIVAFPVNQEPNCPEIGSSVFVNG